MNVDVVDECGLPFQIKKKKQERLHWQLFKNRLFRCFSISGICIYKWRQTKKKKKKKRPSYFSLSVLFRTGFSVFLISRQQQQQFISMWSCMCSVLIGFIFNYSIGVDCTNTLQSANERSQRQHRLWVRHHHTFKHIIYLTRRFQFK